MKIKKKRIFKNKREQPKKFCKCGCGTEIPQQNQWVKNHNHRKTGKSINPKGRKNGSQNKATEACKVILSKEIPKLNRIMVMNALGTDENGNQVSQPNINSTKWLLGRLVPARIHAKIKLAGMPEIKTAEDCKAGIAFLVKAVSQSKISPHDANIVSGILDKFNNSVSIVELEQKMEVLLEQLQST